jgi:hypothetical protein
VNSPTKGPCAIDSSPAPMCYTPAEAAIIDPAYVGSPGQTSSTLCSDGLGGTVSTNFNRFASDSIDDAPFNSQPIPLSKSLTVTLRFGGLDEPTAVPQGMYWWAAVRTQPPPAVCTENAPQEIPSTSDGATDIANDIIANCK